MICITINQESRRFALVDMLNAAGQCDLLEIRLDRFGMAPDLGELLAHKPKPVIMSCRRPKDGGAWDGTEAERLALLRQAIISQADYIEIELDVADQIQRHGSTRRVIACTIQPNTSVEDILEAYDEAQTKDPDVIKITTSARTPEEAWPIVQLLARPPVPTVAVGMGKPGVMLTILAKKVDAPWTYAALEKGMEAYPGQPTVQELREVYDYKKIARGTRLLGVTGFEEREFYTVAGLNAALAHLELSARCLPLAVGSRKLFGKVIELVKLAGVVIDPENQQRLLDLVEERHPTVEHAQAVDLIVDKADRWHGYYTAGQGAVAALADTLRLRTGSDEPLRGRMILVAGLSPAMRTLGAELEHRKANVTLASRNIKAVQALAQEIGCRHIPFSGISAALYDTLIVCDEEVDELAARQDGLHPSAFKEGVTVLDLKAGVRATPLLDEARRRGCYLVPPREVLLQQLDLQTRLLTLKQVPRDIFEDAIPDLLEGEW